MIDNRTKVFKKSVFKGVPIREAILCYKNGAELPIKFRCVRDYKKKIRFSMNSHKNTEIKKSDFQQLIILK